MIAKAGADSWSGRRRVPVLALLVATAVVLALALWVALARILKVDRGLDLTDEGFYLVAADPPDLSAVWGFPFGWHTRPLFALVGWDIAAFRTLGAVILVLVAALLGWRAASVVSGDEGTSATRVFRALVVVSAAVGVLIYYSSMLRVPSYNWLGLVGIMTSLIGVCWLVQLPVDPSKPWRTALGPAIVSSVGLFLTLPAKPSTAPLMVAFGLVALWLMIGRGPALRWALWAVAAAPVWVAIAVLVRLWPTDFVRVLSLALQMPTPDPAQTLPGAVQRFLLVPRDAIAGIAAIPDRAFLVLVVVLGVLLIPPLLRRRWWALRLAAQAGAGVVALAVAGVPVPLINATGLPLGLARSTTTTCLLIVLSAAALARWRLTSRESPDTGRLCRSRVVLVLLLLVSACVFAFGSDNGVLGQASIAGGLVLLSAALATGGPALDRTTVSTTAVVALTTLAVVVAGLVGGWRFPQRSAPLAEQTVPTAIGTHGATLRLDAATSGAINGLGDQARQAGWTAQTPLVDASYTWHPGMAYALGGRVPQSLQLTIFGYGAAHEITDFHLSSPFLDFPFERAWLLTSAPEVLDESARSATDFTLSKLAKVTGRAVPSGYVCMSAGEFVLWKPSDAPVVPDSCGW